LYCFSTSVYCCYFVIDLVRKRLDTPSYCNAVYCFGRITFRRILLLPSSGWREWWWEKGLRCRSRIQDGSSVRQPMEGGLIVISDRPLQVPWGRGGGVQFTPIGYGHGWRWMK